MREKFYETKVGRWLLLYLASIQLWLWDVQGIVAHATGGNIGSKSSPMDTPEDPTLNIKSNKVWDSKKEGGNGKTLAENVEPFMLLITTMTFGIGFLCALAGLFANSAKLSMAIQSGNASGVQKHLKDHTTFYINTAIVFSALFVLEILAWFFGIQGFK